jgi:hypothetical protein
MALNLTNNKRVLDSIVETIRDCRQSIKSIGCKISCAEDGVGLLYEAKWAMFQKSVLLGYTHVSSDAQGLPSAFYFDGEKNYFIETHFRGNQQHSTAHVLQGSSPMSEPSPLKSSYFFYGSWIDELISNHKAKITAINESAEHGKVYTVRMDIPRRTLIVDLSEKYNFAIVKTSELRSDGGVVNECSDFEQFGDVWLPHRDEFNSKWKHNDIASSWHRSYVFADIALNSLSASDASWKFNEGSTITDGIANKRLVLVEGKWLPYPVQRLHEAFHTPELALA